jgi:hypothetical protein
LNFRVHPFWKDPSIITNFSIHPFWDKPIKFQGDIILDRKLFSESECGYLPIFAKKATEIKTGPAKNPKIEE